MDCAIAEETTEENQEAQLQAAPPVQPLHVAPEELLPEGEVPGLDGDQLIEHPLEIAAGGAAQRLVEREVEELVEHEPATQPFEIRRSRRHRISVPAPDRDGRRPGARSPEPAGAPPGGSDPSPGDSGCGTDSRPGGRAGSESRRPGQSPLGARPWSAARRPRRAPACRDAWAAGRLRPPGQARRACPGT